jgi:hypothetical protein
MIDDRTPSLREQILLAVNTGVIDALLAIGGSHPFRFASTRTRARWRAAAKKRRKELA